MSPRRDGAALLVAVLFLLLIDGIVLGTVQIAAAERRIAGTSVRTLQLRLAAEGAAAGALLAWTAAADTLSAGEQPIRLHVPPPIGAMNTEATLQALPAGVFMIVARAREPAPGFGTAAVALLVTPPPLPPRLDPDAAALSAATLLASSGSITRSAGDCSATLSPFALRLADPASLVASPALLIDGAVDGMPSTPSLPSVFPRLATAAGNPAVHYAEADLVIDSATSGVILVAGDARLNAGAHVAGLLVVVGTLHIEAGARFLGAAHSGGAATVEGSLILDSCQVAAAIAAARLKSPRLLRHRPLIPAF